MPIEDLNIENDWNTDDIEPPVPIPAGTYNAMLSDINIRATQAGTGQNIVFQFKITGDPSPKINGRTLNYYANLPNPEDAEKITNSGQSFKDFKLSQILKLVTTLGGKKRKTVADSLKTIQPNAKAKITVTQVVREETQERMSRITEVMSK